MMASGSFVNPNISGVSHLASNGSNTLTFSNMNYGKISASETNNTFGVPSHFYNSYHGYCDNNQAAITSNTNASLLSSNMVGDCTETYLEPHSSPQNSNHDSLASRSSRFSYNIGEYDNTRLSGCNYSNITRELTSCQSSPPNGIVRCEDQHNKKREEVPSNTDLQPLRRFPINQYTSNPIPDTSLIQTSHSPSQIINIESNDSKFSKIKNRSINSTVSAPNSVKQFNRHSSDIHSDMYSVSSQLMTCRHLPVENRHGLPSNAARTTPQILQGQSGSATYSSAVSRHSTPSEMEVVQRNSRRMGARNAATMWTARGGNNKCAVTLFNGDMWAKFHCHTNEMIITKHGRRMFPVLHFTISGLDPKKSYNVYVDMIIADNSHWKFQGGKWVSCGNAEPLPIDGRTYHHPDSPNTGAHWMKQDVNFGKLKLTNNKTCKQKQVILNSMHRYQPRIHVSEYHEGKNGDALISHAFVDTQFIAVTAYQNTDITDLKVKFNPYARGMQDKNSFNGGTILPDAVNHHQSFLALPSPHQHVNKPTASQTMNSSSPTYQQRHLQYLQSPGPNIHGTFLEHHENVSTGKRPRSEILQQEFPKSSSFDIGHDVTFPQQGAPSSSLISAYAPETSKWSHYSPAAKSGHEGYINFNRNLGFVTGSREADFGLPNENIVKMEETCMHGQELCMISPQTSKSLNLPCESSLTTHRSSFSSIPISPGYSVMPYDINQNSHEKYGFPIRTQQTSTGSESIFLYSSPHDQYNYNKWAQGYPASNMWTEGIAASNVWSDVHSISNKWANEVPTSNTQLSPDEHEQKWCSSLASYFLKQADCRYLQNRTSPHDSHLKSHEQQHVETEPNTYQLLQQSSLYSSGDILSRTYSSFDTTRQQKSHFLHPSFNRDSEDAAAKEFDELQKEAAEVSLDFMSRDVQLTSDKVEFTIHSKIPKSSTNSLYKSTPALSSIEAVSSTNSFLLTPADKQHQDSVVSDTIIALNDCSNNEIANFNQTWTDNQISESCKIATTHTQLQINTKKLYIDNHKEKSQSQACRSTNSSSLQSIVPATILSSNIHSKQVKSEKRKPTEHGSISDIYSCKKTKVATENYLG